MGGEGGLRFDMVDCMSSSSSQEHHNLMCLPELIVPFKYNLKCRPVCSGGGVVQLIVLCQENWGRENHSHFIESCHPLSTALTPAL